MTQHVVVWRPDPTHTARALGPYRSAEKAEAVLEDMLALEDELELHTGFDDDLMSWLPQVVEVEDWRTVKAELIAQYSEPPEEEGS